MPVLKTSDVISRFKSSFGEAVEGISEPTNAGVIGAFMTSLKKLEIDEIALGRKTMKTMTTRKSKEEVQAELELVQKKKIQEKHTIVEIYKII
ncbi:unnamed protein product [Sphagnum balticum]